MSIRISQAYQATKPELNVLLPPAVAKVAKFIASANEKGIGPGFWVPRYVNRASFILSAEETLETPDSTNGLPECEDHLESSALNKKQEEKSEDVQEDLNASPAPSESTRKRAPSCADLDDDTHKSQEDNIEDNASLQVEKKQRVE